MLKLPGHTLTIEDTGETVTWYEDDRKFWQFYVVPNFPTVRRQTSPADGHGDGDPVFLLIKYAFSDQQRASNPDLPVGGGYLVFDAELAISSVARLALRKELGAIVQQRWAEVRAALVDPSGPRSIEATATLKDMTDSAEFDPSVWQMDDPERFLGETELGFAMDAPETEDDVTLPAEFSGIAPASLPEQWPMVEHEDGTEGPLMVFADPTWVGGTVNMTVPAEGGGLVRASVKERPAATFGNNVAAFSVDLTSDGATFFEKTLVGDGGGAATNLTPIQIAYNLTMLAKLPPARARVQVKTQSAWQFFQDLIHEKHNSYDDYITTENIMTAMINAGAMRVQVDAGGVTDETLIKALMDQASQVGLQVLLSKFANPVEATDDEDFDAWSGRTEEGASGSTDPTTGASVTIIEGEVFRMKREAEIDVTDFDQIFELQTTIEQTIAPQGTLQTFLGDASAEDMSRFVRVIDLEDQMFGTLGLEVQAFAEWGEDIAFVEVEVKYQGRDEAGEHVVKTQSFTFTGDDDAAQTWDPRLLGGKREYAYRWRVAFQGQEPEPWNDEDADDGGFFGGGGGGGPFARIGGAVGSALGGALDNALGGLFGGSPMGGLFGGGGNRDRKRKNNAGWVRNTARRINVSVATPGKLDVDITGVALDFAGVVRAAIVHLAYADEGLEVAPQSHTVVLTGAQPTANWQRKLFAEWRQPLSYRVDYVLQNGKMWRRAWQQTQGVQSTIVVEPPAVDTLDVALVPVGRGWDEVKLVTVGIRHPGSNEDEFYALKSDAEFKKWSALLQDSSDRTFEVQTIINYASSDLEDVQIDWQRSEGDQAVPIEVPLPPRLDVRLITAAVDWAYTPLVTVHLSYEDRRDRSFSAEETLTLEEGADKVDWRIPIREDGPRKYRHRVTYHTRDNVVDEREEVLTEETVIVVPGLSEYKVGCSVKSALVDFAVTPAVEVELSYRDPQNGIEGRTTLIFDAKDTQEWWVPVEKASPSFYDARITYYTADGEPVVTATRRLLKTSWLIPRYQPPAE